jgi:signal transduction histidine kinase
LHHGLLILKPQNPTPCRIAAAMTGVAVCLAFVLQLTGTMGFMRMLPAFHIIISLGITTLMATVVFEYIRYKNQNARAFMLPTLIMIVTTAIELINFRLRFTTSGQLAVVGALSFTVCLGFNGVRGLVSLQTAYNESKRREDELADKNAVLDSLNQMKSEFLANISHELTTPLTVMSGYAQQTRREIESNETDEETTRNLRVIQSEAHRLADLAHQMLYTSKNLQTGIEIKATSPAEILERANAICGSILAKNGNSLITTGDEDLPDVAANLDMILQVILNLCTNANRHTKNGSVTLSAEMKSEGFVEFIVRDNGGGISPELLPDVFTRGVSGDDKTGLGLVICQDVIRQHGGRITIDSVQWTMDNEKRGTTVTFTIPIAQRREDHDA